MVLEVLKLKAELDVVCDPKLKPALGGADDGFDMSPKFSEKNKNQNKQ